MTEFVSFLNFFNGFWIKEEIYSKALMQSMSPAEQMKQRCCLTLFFKVLLLTNFKHGPEDEECPVPEDVRDTLGDFHNDLLLHCGEMFLLILQV